MSFEFLNANFKLIMREYKCLPARLVQFWALQIYSVTQWLFVGGTVSFTVHSYPQFTIAVFIKNVDEDSWRAVLLNVAAATC